MAAAEYTTSEAKLEEEDKERLGVAVERIWRQEPRSSIIRA